MSEKPKITAFRFQRELERLSKVELTGLSFALSQNFEGFRPQKHHNVGFTILSANEVAIAYKEAPEDSPIKAKHHDIYQQIAKGIMDKSKTFNLHQTIYNLDNNTELLSTMENQSNRFLVFNLDADWAASELSEGAEALEEITYFKSSIKEPGIILGTLKPDVDTDYIISAAESMINEGAVDLSSLSFLPGEMLQNISKKILTPRSQANLNK